MIKKILIPQVYLPIIYIVVAFVIYAILNKIITTALKINKFEKRKSALQLKREKTVINLLRSILKYIIAIILILAILMYMG